jgi:DNA segregation ATPase FtsK/SpoIIIE-like protein
MNELDVLINEIKTNIDKPYYKYIAKVFRDNIFFAEAYKLNIPTVARNYFDIDNIKNDTYKNYSQNVLNALENEEIYNYVSNILYNYKNTNSVGTYIYTIYIQITRIIHELFKNYTYEQAKQSIQNFYYDLEQIYTKYNNLRCCNFHNLQNEKTINGIEEKIYEHLYTNGVLNKSLTLDNMIDIFTSHKNLVKSINITNKLLELIEHKKQNRVTPKYTIATLYREVFEKKLKNYQGYNNIYNSLNYSNQVYFSSIFMDVKNLVKEPENIKVFDELLEAEQNFTKIYTDIKLSFIQFNSIINLIVNNSNLSQFDRFTNEYCRFVSDLCILHSNYHGSSYYYTRDNPITNEEEKIRFVYSKLCITQDVFNTNGKIINDVIKFLYEKLNSLKKENENEQQRQEQIKQEQQKQEQQRQEQQRQEQQRQEQQRQEQIKQDKEKLKSEQKIKEKENKNNIVLDIEYNTKKPNYKKDDLLKLALDMKIVGASRLTVALLEEAIIQNLKGDTMELKANKINITGKDITEKGFKVAILEKLTNTMEEIVVKSNLPKTIKSMVWNKYIGKEKGIGKCYVCSEDLDSKHFELGHIQAKAKGGSDEIDNLRPICSLCNKSIGTKNMDEFKKTYKLK